MGWDGEVDHASDTVAERVLKAGSVGHFERVKDREGDEAGRRLQAGHDAEDIGRDEAGRRRGKGDMIESLQTSTTDQRRGGRGIHHVELADAERTEVAETLGDVQAELRIDCIACRKLQRGIDRQQRSGCQVVDVAAADDFSEEVD